MNLFAADADHLAVRAVLEEILGVRFRSLFLSLFGLISHACFIRYHYAGPSTPKGSQVYASIETQTPWWAARDTKKVSGSSICFRMTHKL